MRQSLFPFSRPQTIGEVLDAGFLLFKRSFLSCLLLSLIGLVLGQIPRVYELATGSERWSPLTLPSPGILAMSIIAGLGTAVVYGAIVLRQYSVAIDRPLALGDVLHRAARRLPGLLAIALVLVLPLLPLAAGVWWFSLGGAVAPAIATGLVALLFLTWWTIALFFAGTLVLIEGLSVGAAVRGSLSLTSGHWWRTLAVFGVATTLLMVLWAIAAVLTAASVSLLARDLVLVMLVPEVVMVFVLAPAIQLMYSIHLALYADLKVRREGVDLSARMDRLGAAPQT